MTDDMIERVARAIKSVSLVPWERIEPRSQADYWFMARAAIAAMPGWQPIETAPKDGPTIIVHRPNFDGDYIPQVGIDWWMFRLDGDCWANSRENCQPTHWIPLPEPPK